MAGMLLGLLAALLAGCGSSQSPTPPSHVTPAPEGKPYDKLGQWHIFRDMKRQLPNDGVVPYEVNAPLYSDYANKHRFMVVPEGKKVGYDPTGDWKFPVGTILVKTFGFLADMRDPSKGERLIETRLLVHESTGWTAHTYLYNDAGTEAVNTVAGADVSVSWIDVHGKEQHNDYGVPNTNDCQKCHGTGQKLDTLGGRTRQLNLDHDYGDGPENEIGHMASLGWFDKAPPPAAQRQTLVDPFGKAPLVDRARAYLDSNCGHCHTKGGGATQSALRLAYGDTDPVAGDPTSWGVCKLPTSAGGATCGLTLDVVPGSPDQSVMICRISATDPKVRMPPLGSRMPHSEGIQLIRDWITAMTPAGCN